MVKIQFLSRKKTTGAQFGEQHLTLGLISHFTQHRDLSPKINPTQSTRGEMVVAAATKTIKIVAKKLFNQKKDGRRDNFYQNKLKWLQQRLFHIQLLFSQLYIYWQTWNEEWYLLIQGFGQLSVICSLALHTVVTTVHLKQGQRWWNICFSNRQLGLLTLGDCILMC